MFTILCYKISCRTEIAGVISLHGKSKQAEVDCFRFPPELYQLLPATSEYDFAIFKNLQGIFLTRGCRKPKDSRNFWTKCLSKSDQLVRVRLQGYCLVTMR